LAVLPEAARHVRQFRQRVGSGAAICHCGAQQSRLAVCDATEAQRLYRHSKRTSRGPRYTLCRGDQRQAACAHELCLSAYARAQGACRSGEPAYDRRVDPEAVSATGLWLFLFAALMIAVVPGPGIFYVAARTLSGGRKAGLASTFGTGLGGLVHVVAGSLGV